MKITKQQIAEYIRVQAKDGAASITVAEIQRNFAIGYIKAREVLDSLPNLTWNPYTFRYTVQDNAGRKM